MSLTPSPTTGTQDQNNIGQFEELGLTPPPITGIQSQDNNNSPTANNNDGQRNTSEACYY